MNKPNIERLEKALEKKYLQKKKRKKQGMKVSGAEVKKLQNIIKKK